MSLTERPRIRTVTKFVGSSPGQWERILFVCYETSGFDLTPNITQSSDDRHRDTWSVDHRREIHGRLEVTHGYLLVFTFPVSMFGCSMFQDLCPVFFEKTGTQSK
jgi:hypothetical protein